MKKISLAVIAIAVAAGVALYLWRRGPSAPPAPPAARPEAASVARPPDTKPKVPERPKGDKDGPPPELALAYDDDPAGTLRLEGQVVDSDERPVAGAAVLLASNPRRQARSEADGSFSFDKLVGRSYAVQAVKDDAVAGATVRLTAKTEPVILRLKEVGGLEVTVLALEDHKPIAGAEVGLHDEPVAGRTTGADGKAVLRGVDKGWHSVEASGPGFADTQTFVETSGRPGALDRQTIELKRGAAASGTVVDPAGKPVAGARVRAVSAASFGFAFGGGARDGVLTDARGRWSIAALPAGTFRFSASQEKHGPGTSAPVILDGRVEHKGIAIAVEAGAHIAGRVVDHAGAPVASAAVRIAVASRGFGGEPARQAFTDDKGRFDIDGLPRKAAELVASSDSASSDITALDLAAKPAQLDLRIALDIGGTIGGTVVDAKGQPIAGAQVMAAPETGGRRDNMSNWRLRGLSQDVTDSAGRFEIHGLPDGGYRLRAARSGDDPMGLWQRPGVAAQVGDLSVRLVVPDDGKVKGKVLFADGTAPKSYQVAVGFGRGTTFAATDGAFEVEAPAGPTTLVVGGSELVQKMVPTVTVTADDVVDVGTITVERGRSVSGRVLRADGSLVAGASVHGGMQLMGNGSDLSAGGLFGAMGGAKSTSSGDDGGYVLSGVGERALVVGAESEADGRSSLARVPPGKDSVQLDLILQPVGSLEGRVTSAGQPLGGTVLIAAPQQASKGSFVVRTDDAGAYRYDKLAPDTYVVSTMAAGATGRGANFRSQMIQVRSGETAHLDIDIPAGTITVSVAVTAPPDANVHAAQVFLISGTIQATTAEQLGDAAAARGAGATHMGFIVKDEAATLDKIEPGSYTACAIPIPGDINDMAAMMRIQGKLDKLLSVCVPAPIAASPDKQSVAIRVPTPPPID